MIVNKDLSIEMVGRNPEITARGYEILKDALLHAQRDVHDVDFLLRIQAIALGWSKCDAERDHCLDHEPSAPKGCCKCDYSYGVKGLT